MNIMLEAKNAKGKEALQKMLTLKRDANLAFKLALSRVKFNASFVQEEPYTVAFNHGGLDKLPFNPIQADMVEAAIMSVTKYLDADKEDVEVIIDGKKSNEW
jgi:hypothetical protein